MAGDAARPRVCLSMIVRDERAVIERCLTSALAIIDAAVICDTGSVDGTAQVAEDLLRQAHVPVRVCQHAWQDFGTNRTAAIHEASRYLHELDWPLRDCYWLFLDADLEIVAEATFDRAALTADALAVRQRSGELSYWNLRLARASLDWRAVGRTHERYVCPAEPAMQRTSALWIRDHGDGGSKADKFERDIAWLSAQLRETPDDARTLFYLAQSYRATGDAMKALILYQRRAAIADGQEEAWYARLSVGQILADADHLEASTAALLDAHAADPCRAEPLFELSRLYLRHQRRDEAVAFAERGLERPMPDDRFHIVHADVYEYKLDLQLADAALGTVHARLGAVACERVLRSRTAPAAALERAQQLAVCYAEPIRHLEYLALRPTLPAPYRACNPSIVRTDTGYTVICRSVNYEQRRLRYRPDDPDGVYRTRNVLMRLDAEFAVVAETEITLDEPPIRESRIQGLEDCRLVSSGDELFFTCATADRHPSGRVHQSICRLDASGRVLSHRPLTGPTDAGIQKNWLPFPAEDGGIRAIQRYDPLTVLTLSPDTGVYQVDAQVSSDRNASLWRGSAGPIAWWHDASDGRGRQLVLVHEAVRRQGHDGEWERVYLHRFVEYDAAFRPTRVSRPFVFLHKGIEFACGMAAAHGGRDLLIGIGIEDREAYLGRIPFSHVDHLLNETAPDEP